MVLFVSASIHVSGQSVHILSNRVGIQSAAVRDIGMSPLSYQGTGFFIGVRLKKEKTSKTNEFQLAYSSGSLENRFADQVNYNSFSFQTYTFYHSVENRKTISWGWSNHNSLFLRKNDFYSNNNQYYDYMTNIGPAVRFDYPFSLRSRQLLFQMVGNTQLIGFFFRPSYTKNDLDGFLDPNLSGLSRFTSSAQLFYPGAGWHVCFRPALYYSLKGNNKISIQYQYEYYQLNSIRPVIQSSGIWLLSLSTKL
jgi:hypothetical protein